MPTLTQLGNVLTSARVVTAEVWQRAVKAGDGDFAETLDALAATPAWWTNDQPTLSEYQRSVIELWWEGGKVALHRQLALNQYLILKKLGQGGQGEVYLCRQLNPARYVAIKTLTQETDARRQRFEQEAKAMMRVVHPGVARFQLYERVRDATGKPTDEYLIAMEYVEGTDLYRMVQENGPPPWKFVARWAVDVLGGLAVIHQNGFIHRDVKPANIMVVGPTPGPRVLVVDSNAKLLDFGAAKLAADVKPVATGPKRVFVGTREYAPPEQWNEQVVPASDVYALGASLFHVMTGRPPYEVEGRDAVAFVRAHSRAPIPDAREYNPDVPVPMSRLLMKMMSKAAEDRGTAAELVGEFRDLLPEALRPPVETATKPKASGPPKSRPPAAIAPPEPEEEERGLAHALLHPFFVVLERLFLPARLRPPAGHEPGPAERLAALLRRPLLLLALLVVIAAVIILTR
jgi:serine/threonine protein kinase